MKYCVDGPLEHEPMAYRYLLERGALIDPWKILTGPVHFRVNLDTLSGYPEPWFKEVIERTY